MYRFFPPLIIYILLCNVHRVVGLKDFPLKYCKNESTYSYKRQTFLGYDLGEVQLVDYTNKILMDWTPKADCTSAVVMFLEHMGIYHKIHYSGWPHEFRLKKFYLQCGYVSTTSYTDSSWIRFKVVRNPYNRAVSSYIHAMRGNLFNIYEHLDIQNISFLEFLVHLSKLPEEKFYKYLGEHARPQHRLFEKYAHEHPESLSQPIYHYIIQAEAPHDELEKLNAKISGRPFTSKRQRYSDTHHAPRNASLSSEFIGDVKWWEIVKRGGIPSNYGVFYNDVTKSYVDKLYKLDILLYGYTFPY